MSSLAIESSGVTRHRSARRSVDRRREQGLFLFSAAQIASIIFLQKIGLPLAGSSAELPLLLMLIGLAAIIQRGWVTVDRTRALLFGAFAILATAATVLNAANLSIASYLEVMALYAPFILRTEISAKTYLRIVEFFLRCMLLICGVIFLQYAVEIAVGASKMPSMNVILPKDWQYPGFTYIRPMEMFHNLVKPNGYFMMEVSILSQFLALGAVLEIIYTQKWWRLAVFVVALIATYAGSGLLLLVVVAPTLLVRASPRILIGISVALVFGLLFASQTHWFAALLSRTDEFQHYNGSARHRFIEPLVVLQEFLTGPHNIFVGIGAGNIEKGNYTSWWPITKVTVEYGILTAVSFFAMLLYCMFRGPPDWRVALAIFLSYFFLNGSFIVPIDVYLCLVFCALFRIRQEPARRRRRRSRSRTAAPIMVGELEGVAPIDEAIPEAAGAFGLNPGLNPNEAAAWRW